MTTGSVPALAATTAALCEKFGQNLTLFRDGNTVRWAYEGQSATVELLSDGAIAAVFLDRPAADAVTGEIVSAVYRRSTAPYRMCAEGCRRMVEDLDDFFSGTREARFTFVGVEAAAI